MLSLWENGFLADRLSEALPPPHLGEERNLYLTVSSENGETTAAMSAPTHTCHTARGGFPAP